MEKVLLNQLIEEKAKLLDAHAVQDYKDLRYLDIMILDDCEDTLFALNHILSKNIKANVKCFKNEFRALKYYMNEKADIILLDINLMKLDGFRMSIILRNLSTFEVPIIFMSSDKNFEYEVKNFYGNETFFISKPVDQELLLRTISQLRKTNEGKRAC